LGLPALTLFGRYTWNAKASVTPVFEAGLGLSFEKLSLESNDLSVASVSERSTRFKARGNAGVMFSWDQSVALSLLAGIDAKFGSSQELRNATIQISRESSDLGFSLRSTLHIFF
jgi:hypothetical protein